MKLWLERQPELFDPELYKFYVNEIWKRAIYPKLNASFNSWGAARFLPYEIVLLYDRSKKVGVDSQTFVITELSHELDASNLSYNIAVKAEYINTSLLQFMPRAPAVKSGKRIAGGGLLEQLRKSIQFGAGEGYDFTRVAGEVFKEVQGIWRYHSSADKNVGEAIFGE
jgi:hypothetical protein